MKINIEQPEKKLTAKEQLFVEAYCQCWNAAKAARKAGYSVKTAKEIGSQNLTKLHISSAIKSLAQSLVMSEDEGAVHLSDWARGSLEPFMTKAGENDFALTISTPKARRNIKLIKKAKQTRFRKFDAEGNPLGEEIKLEIELYDAKDAVVKLLEMQGKLKKTGDDGVTVNIIYPEPK